MKREGSLSSSTAGRWTFLDPMSYRGIGEALLARRGMLQHFRAAETGTRRRVVDPETRRHVLVSRAQPEIHQHKVLQSFNDN